MLPELIKPITFTVRTNERGPQRNADGSIRPARKYITISLTGNKIK